MNDRKAWNYFFRLIGVLLCLVAIPGTALAYSSVAVSKYGNVAAVFNVPNQEQAENAAKRECFTHGASDFLGDEVKIYKPGSFNGGSGAVILWLAKDRWVLGFGYSPGYSIDNALANALANLINNVNIKGISPSEIKTTKQVTWYEYPYVVDDRAQSVPTVKWFNQNEYRRDPLNTLDEIVGKGKSYDMRMHTKDDIYCGGPCP